MATGSISKSSFWGTVTVSWLSILILGVAWVGIVSFDFSRESSGLRENHYAEQKALVQREVEKSVKLVEAMRQDHLVALRSEVRERADLAYALGSQLASIESLSPKVLGETVVASLGAAGHVEVNPHGLFNVAAFDDSVVLLSEMPQGMNISRLIETLKGTRGGERQISFTSVDGEQNYTLFIVVRELEGVPLLIVSGACLEVAEEKLKEDVVQELERIRFGDNGYIFGATWKGVSVVGPAKGRNVWKATDSNGVRIVQELVAVARQGGGFVSYVMPEFEGALTTDKISYAMPIPAWEWYLGAGQYVDDIESVIALNRERLIGEVVQQGWMILIGLLGLSVAAFFLSRRLAQRMAQNLDAFSGVWSRASSRGGDIDPDSLYYREFKDLAVAANRMSAARRASDEKANESNAQLQALIKSIPGIIFRCGPDEFWSMHFISDSVEEITGYPPAEFINNAVRSFSDIIDPRDRAWVMEIVAESIRSGEPYSLEYRIKRKDGQIIWAFEKGQVRFDGEGNPIFLDGAIFDVTDRKQAQDERFQHLHHLETMERIDEKVRSNYDIEEMLWEVMEIVRNAFGADRSWLLYPCDPDAAFFKVPIERYTEKFPGANSKEMEVPVDSDIKDVFVRALRASGPVAYDPESGIPLPVGSSEIFGVKSQLTMAIYPRTGKPWLMGMHQCTSDRVWTEDDQRLFKEASRRVSDALSNLLILKELQESEERFRTFSEQTMLGLSVVQGDVVVFANQAFCDIFEVSVDEMLSLEPFGFLRFVHPDDQPFLIEQAKKKQAGEPDAVPSYTWRAITSTGRVRNVQIHSKTVTLNGRTADLVSLTDITDMHRSQAQLEDLVEERTADLAAKAAELEIANDRLVRLDELKSSFVTTVSHDLRTPLTSVLGYAKLIRRDLDNTLPDLGCTKEGEKLKERIRANIGIMTIEGERLSSLVDEFMDLTAMEAGTATWYDNLTDMSESIIQTVKQAKIRAAIKPALDISLNISGSLPSMSIDAIRFKQMLAHLLDNAIHFSESGPIIVFAESPDGVGVTLSVTDPGKGIPTNELEAIFEPFHQVETGDTLVDTVKGSGLGLSLSLGIVRHYGGTIKVDSLPGKGSTFRVDLPGNRQG